MFKVLIIDDSETLLEVLQYAFEKYQMEVFIAKTQTQIQTSLKENNFDLIISDLSFSEFDGISLAKYLRKEIKNKTPLFLMAKNNKAEIKLQAKEAGADGWILKPFIAELLAKNIRKYLKYQTK